MLRPMIELNSADVKLMLKKLRDIEPDAVKLYKREIRTIAKPVADDIQRRIPSDPPLSGMGFTVRRLLGYETSTTLDEGLTELVEWIRDRGVKDFEYHLPIEIESDRLPDTWAKRLF